MNECHLNTDSAFKNFRKRDAESLLQPPFTKHQKVWEEHALYDGVSNIQPPGEEVLESFKMEMDEPPPTTNSLSPMEVDEPMYEISTATQEGCIPLFNLYNKNLFSGT
jgi:hypothetical protein